MGHEMHIKVLKMARWKQYFSIKLDHVMDTQFELQYKAVAELQATSLC